MHVIPGLSALYGGPTLAALEMCRELNRQHIETLLVTTNADVQGTLAVSLGTPIETGGVSILYFDSPFARKYGMSWTLPRWMDAHLQEFDLLHLHSFFSYLTLPLGRTASRLGMPYVIRPLGQLNSYSLAQNGLVKRAYLNTIGKPCLNRAALVHCTSQDEMLAVRRLGITAPCAVLPLGVRQSTDAPLSRGEFRAQHPELQSKKLIVMLARLDPIKGLDLLLEAVQQLCAMRDDFVLVVAGAGDKAYVEQLRSTVRTQKLPVQFWGFLGGVEKASLLANADMLVMPSYSENFGQAAVEAMAAGVPIIISDQVGIHREVSAAGAGIVVLCNANLLAGAINTLLDNEPHARALGQAGKKLVEERYRWETVTRELIQQYHALLTQRAAVPVAA